MKKEDCIKEIEKLREEKDRKIEELQTELNNYKTVNDINNIVAGLPDELTISARRALNAINDMYMRILLTRRAMTWEQALYFLKRLEEKLIEQTMKGHSNE